MRYPSHLVKLIQQLRKLPGVGSRSAERFVFEMISWPHSQRMEMIDAIAKIPHLLPHCSVCRCLSGPEAVCPFCDPSARDTDLFCITATTRDVFAIEETRKYNGLYHVLGRLLSPLDGMDVSPPDLSAVKQRLASSPVREIILAFDRTLEGDATALYLKQELAEFGIPLSRLMFELPTGSAFDYIDSDSLSDAIVDRKSL
jgi:recombination protein RecR